MTVLGGEFLFVKINRKLVDVVFVIKKDEMRPRTLTESGRSRVHRDDKGTCGWVQLQQLEI